MTGQSAAQTGSTKPGQKAPDFLVHEDGDSVGVIVIEGLKAGTEMTGWIMAQDRTVSMKVLNDIPIGHKIALEDLAVGDSVIKYGVNIGKVVADVAEQLGLGDLVADQIIDVPVQLIDPHHTDDRQCSQQDQYRRESDSKTHPNFQILEHVCTPLS